MQVPLGPGEGGFQRQLQDGQDGRDSVLGRRGGPGGGVHPRLEP